jgi:hypothetical protein
VKRQLERTTAPIALPSPLAPADARTHQDMAALADDELATINLDVLAAIDVIMTALPELRAVEARMVASWREPPVGLLDRLERYAAALLQAHLLCQGLSAEHPDLSDMAKELTCVRQHLLRCTRALVVTGNLAEDLLAPFQDAKGHRPLVRSVCGIVAVCWSHWAHIEHKTPLSMAELDRAQSLAQRLLHAVMTRQRTPAPLAQALRARRQAFTLLLRAYTELRNAAKFLYPTREAERRVPSLFRKRPRAQRSACALPCAASA